MSHLYFLPQPIIINQSFQNPYFNRLFMPNSITTHSQIISSQNRHTNLPNGPVTLLPPDDQ